MQFSSNLEPFSETPAQELFDIKIGTGIWQIPLMFGHPRARAIKLLNLYQLPQELSSSMNGQSSFHLFTPSNFTTLIASIKDGDLGQLKEEIALREYDINEPINGRYPLHFAASYGHLDIIEYLLACGAEVNVTDLDGVTPLLCAVYEGRTCCVEALLKHGANAGGRTPDNKTYLEAADVEEIRTLLRKK